MSCGTDFDHLAQFAGSGCEKYDSRKAIFGRDDVIPLWVADMDFPAPDCVVDALRRRLDHPAFGYVAADDAYFAAIVDWLAVQHDWHVAPETIVPLPGVVPGMALAIQTFTQPGDGVIVQPPVYRPFLDLPSDNERHRIDNALRLDNGRYRFDFEHLERVAPQARMLLLCNPHNPGGRTWSRAELDVLAEICARHDVLVVADEIHMDLIYPAATSPVATPSGAPSDSPSRDSESAETRNPGNEAAIARNAENRSRDAQSVDAPLPDGLDIEAQGMHTGGQVPGNTCHDDAARAGAATPHVNTRIVTADADTPDAARKAAHRSTQEAAHRSKRGSAHNSGEPHTDEAAAQAVRHTPFGPVAERHGCRWISITAPGKTFNTAGIGGGYAVVANADLRARYRRAKRAAHWSDTDVFGRVALLSAYQHGKDWPTTLMRFIAEQRERVRRALIDTPLRIIEPEATYLLWLDCRELGLSDVQRDPQDRALRRRFVDDARVGLSEGVWFGAQGAGFMRMNLATTPQTLDTALERIHTALHVGAASAVPVK